MEINNKELILPLLNFEQKGDFYMLYIFVRKKDQPDDLKDNHQSVRTIKTYCIESIEYLEKRWEEIVHLCEFFRARAYIHVQKQNHKDVGFSMMVELATRMKDGGNNFKNLFDSVVGQIKTYEKRWIIDLDIEHLEWENVIYDWIVNSPPLGHKLLATIPTKNGKHLITSPFDVSYFQTKLDMYKIPKPDLQKKNPTVLYIPNSLN